MVGRRAAALVAVAALLGCETRTLLERDWVAVETPHFAIVSSLGPEETRQLTGDLERFHAAVSASGELDRARARQATAWLWSEISDSLLDRFRADDRVAPHLPEVEAAVAAGSLAPTQGARRLLALAGWG